MSAVLYEVSIWSEGKMRAMFASPIQSESDLVYDNLDSAGEVVTLCEKRLIKKSKTANIVSKAFEGLLDESN